MHDPHTVAFEIKYPWKRKPCKLWPKGYRATFITIWHVDPEKDGTDDSCGWFKRARHGDEQMLARIKKDFRFDFDHGWFAEDGKPRLSTIAIGLGMFRVAAWEFYNHDRRRTDRFMNEYLYDIISFSENNVDSLHNSIVGTYGFPDKEERISYFAAIVYGCLLRWTQPWYKHPRWHVWHWRIQFHPWQNLKRRFWDRCSKCGKRGFKPEHGSAVGNWSGTEIWHSTCDGQAQAAKPDKEAA